VTSGTLLVTGGAGFIGCNFVRHVLATDPATQVVNLDLLTYAGRRESLADLEGDPRHLFVHGDIRDAPVVEAVFRGTLPAMRERSFAPVDRVVHFAAESHVDRSIGGPAVFVSTNVQGTLTLLDAARAAWAGRGPDGWGGARFLHVSTDEVYGALGPEGRFTETSPLAPNSPYSASKAGSDLLVRAFVHTYGLPAVITRCSNNYGPFQLPEKFIPVVIEAAREGRPIPVYGDGRQVRDWLHVSDHVRAVLRVLAAGRVGEVYNVGGGNEWANLDLAGLLCDLVDARTGRADSRQRIALVTDRPGHDRRYAVDATKVRSELGWAPEVAFEAGIAATVDWYLAEREWVEAAKKELPGPGAP
jgi:dTDP-glucose 4,6-dehydratase